MMILHESWDTVENVLVDRSFLEMENNVSDDLTIEKKKENDATHAEFIAKDREDYEESPTTFK